MTIPLYTIGSDSAITFSIIIMLMIVGLAKVLSIFVRLIFEFAKGLLKGYKQYGKRNT